MARGPGKGNTNNPDGKPKGTPNKLTRQMRELVRDVVDGEMPHFIKKLHSIRDKEPIEYLKLVVSLMKMITPQAVNVDVATKPSLVIEVRSEEEREAIEKIGD